MIEWSERVRALPGYPLAEIPSIKRRLIEAGRDVIDLGAGDSDTPPPAPVVEALREAVKDPALSKYGFQQGLPAFRQAASAYVERRFGQRFDPQTETLAAHRVQGRDRRTSRWPWPIRATSAWCPSRAIRPTSAGRCSRPARRTSFRSRPRRNSCSSSRMCPPMCWRAPGWLSSTIPTTRRRRSRRGSTSSAPWRSAGGTGSCSRTTTPTAISPSTDTWRRASSRFRVRATWPWSSSRCPRPSR